MTRELDDLYKAANDLAREGEAEKAIELYRQVTERYPEAEEAKYAQVNIDTLAGRAADEHRPAPLICGFWRRLGAFAVDVVILGCAGIALGMAFFEYFASLGFRGRAVGFVIALLYFGIQNSSLAKGRTRYALQPLIW